MKVRVDLDACEAHGVCMALCPDVFELDDDDVTHVLVQEVPPEYEETVRRAIQKCPKQALSADD